MIVKFRGTRGSAPSLSSRRLRYGGHTTCLEVRTDADDIIIIDAGTGIRDLGTELIQSFPDGKSCSIFFTHKHWDHMYGLTTFKPLYAKGWNVKLSAPDFGGHYMEQSLRTMFTPSYFPLMWEQIGGKHSVVDFAPKASFQVGSAFIETFPTCHPCGNVAYKITADGWSFVFSGDHEWQEENTKDNEELIAFMHDADVVIGDCHFFESEYEAHKGWGHSTLEQWINKLAKTKVQRFIATHHHPDHGDDDIDKNFINTFKKYTPLPFLIQMAHDGMKINNDRAVKTSLDDIDSAMCPLCSFTARVSRIADHNVALEEILSEARLLCHADAGTIYLVNDEKRLEFAYAQNDTLFPGSAANKMLYLNATIPFDTKSIAGYCASKEMSLNIGDVHNLPSGVPYAFNASFDVATKYKTVSMLAIPLVGSMGVVIGVLQLINSLDQYGEPSSFSLRMQSQLERIAAFTADTIEKNRMSLEMITRMFETSALRDPTETAMHVLRVGSISAELYVRWAEKRCIPQDVIRSTKATMKHAAMLHDVGKVAIPDGVLKKPAKLTDEEFEIIKTHCFLGSTLSKKLATPLDVMAYNIVLQHHQKWNGQGYTGDINTPPLAGEDIPFEARIVSIADVYDALVSPRCYKEPFPIEKALAILQKDAGSHFDPEMVEAFIEIKDIVQAITLKYAE